MSIQRVMHIPQLNVPSDNENSRITTSYKSPSSEYDKISPESAKSWPPVTGKSTKIFGMYTKKYIFQVSLCTIHYTLG